MENDLDLQLGDDVDTVLQRHSETIAWCAPLTDLSRPQACFRSPELAPPMFDEDRKRTVAGVAQERQIALVGKKRMHSRTWRNDNSIILISSSQSFVFRQLKSEVNQPIVHEIDRYVLNQQLAAPVAKLRGISNHRLDSVSHEEALRQ